MFIHQHTIITRTFAIDCARTRDLSSLKRACLIDQIYHLVLAAVVEVESADDTKFTCTRAGFRALFTDTRARTTDAKARTVFARTLPPKNHQRRCGDALLFDSTTHTRLDDVPGKTGWLAC